MALEEYGEGNGVFLKIKHGGIIQESKTERDGYKKVEGVVDGTPYKKWIRPYKAVSGFIDKIERYDREFSGKKIRGWNIHITDGEGRYVLDIPFTSARVNSRWMKLAEAIDYSKPVRFSAWHDKKSDSMALNVQQDGVTVPQKYTREEPNGLPEPTQRSSGKWDYGEQEDFLTERMLKFVIPNVELIAAKRTGANGTAPQETSSGLEPDDSESEDDSTVIKDLKRTVKALAGTKAIDNASAETLLKDSFGLTDWEEIAKLPEPLLQAVLVKLDNLIPF